MVSNDGQDISNLYRTFMIHEWLVYLNPSASSWMAWTSTLWALELPWVSQPGGRASMQAARRLCACSGSICPCKAPGRCVSEWWIMMNSSQLEKTNRFGDIFYDFSDFSCSRSPSPMEFVSNVYISVDSGFEKVRGPCRRQRLPLNGGPALE